MKTPTLLTVLAASALLPLAGLRASPTLDIVENSAGITQVALSQDIQVGALQLGLTLSPVEGSTTAGGGSKVNFPITGGAVDAATAVGEVIHRGGLTIKNSQGRQVTASSFVIDLNDPRNPVLTALITLNGNGVGRIELLAVTVPGFSLPLKVNGSGQVKIKNIQLNLTQTAADALNRALGITQFTAGFNVGTAKLVAYPGQAL